MKRADIRQLKRSVRTRHDSDAMQTLLARSVQFGHKRLALIRCMMLEQMGAQPAPELLRYCQVVADSMSPEALGRILLQGAGLKERACASES